MRQALEHLLRQTWQTRGWLSCVLWPLSWVMGGLVSLKQALYRWGVFIPNRLPVPVIVVGNVMVGGVGKTPIVMALVEHLTRQGLRVGVVSRGYGRDAQDRQTHPIREVTSHSLAQQVGDEPLLIHTRCQVPVWIGAQRAKAACALMAAHPDVQVIVSDDGLQHAALARDIELCVFDERGIGNGWLLPAGPLREPWPRSAPANITHRFELNTSSSELAFAKQAYSVQRRLSEVAYQANGTQRHLQHWQQHRAQALAGIAKPQVFFNMLQAQGVQLTNTIPLPDHASTDQLNAALAHTQHSPTDVLCTEKDAVKLWPTQPEVWAVPLVVELPQGLLDELQKALSTLVMRPSHTASPN
jgi:tetraacyldisaccharide 4'-kinase